FLPGQLTDPMLDMVSQNRYKIVLTGFKGVIRTVQEKQGGQFQAVANPFHQSFLSQRIPRSLQKQHWDFNLLKMGSTVRAWLAGRVKRKTGKNKCTYLIHGFFRHGLGSHPPPERLTTGNKGDSLTPSHSLSNSVSYRAFRYGRDIGPTASALHIREIKTQRRYFIPGEGFRQPGHKRMRH